MSLEYRVGAVCPGCGAEYDPSSDVLAYAHSDGCEVEREILAQIRNRAELMIQQMQAKSPCPRCAALEAKLTAAQEAIAGLLAHEVTGEHEIDCSWWSDATHTECSCGTTERINKARACLKEKP